MLGGGTRVDAESDTEPVAAPALGGKEACTGVPVACVTHPSEPERRGTQSAPAVRVPRVSRKARRERRELRVIVVERG